MRRALALLVLVTVATVGIVDPASAQGPPSLGRDLGRPLPRRPEPSPEEAATPDAATEEAETAEPERPWAGPQVQLAYGYWNLSDGYGGGDVHEGALEVFLQTPVEELRLGLLAALGGRDYILGGDDLVARGAVEVGFQLTELIDPLVPHLSLVVSFGAVVGNRFDTTVAYAFGGAGFEIGAALRLVRNLHLSAAFSYQRLEMDGAAFDVFMLRAAVGI